MSLSVIINILRFYNFRGIFHNNHALIKINHEFCVLGQKGCAQQLRFDLQPARHWWSHVLPG